MSEARVRVSLVDGTIEIEGTESFVTAQLERFGDPIRAVFTAKDLAVESPQPSTVDLNGVFNVSDGGIVHVVPDIPGRNGREQMVNAARLLAYGAERLQNRPNVKFADLKAICQAHRCYDRGNFGAALKKHRASFVLDGRRRQQTIGLTDSGRREAESLIRMLVPPISLS